MLTDLCIYTQLLHNAKETTCIYTHVNNHTLKNKIKTHQKTCLEESSFQICTQEDKSLLYLLLLSLQSRQCQTSSVKCSAEDSAIITITTVTIKVTSTPQQLHGGASTKMLHSQQTQRRPAEMSVSSLWNCCSHNQSSKHWNAQKCENTKLNNTKKYAHKQ